MSVPCVAAPRWFFTSPSWGDTSGSDGGCRVCTFTLHLVAVGSVTQHSAPHSGAGLVGVSEEAELPPLDQQQWGNASIPSPGWCPWKDLYSQCPASSGGRWCSFSSQLESGGRILERRELEKGILQMKSWAYFLVTHVRNWPELTAKDFRTEL